MEQDIRWLQRYDSFHRANKRIQEITESDKKVDDLSELEMEGLIQRFEYTFELGWKVLQDLLKYKGNEIAKVTLEAYAYRVAKYIGSYTAASMRLMASPRTCSSLFRFSRSSRFSSSKDIFAAIVASSSEWRRRVSARSWAFCSKRASTCVSSCSSASMILGIALPHADGKAAHAANHNFMQR